MTIFHTLYPNTWSFQLIIDAFSSGIEVGKVTESLREGTFLKKSLPMVTLRAVGSLGSKPMFFSLFLEEDKAKVSEEAFLKIKEAEILLEKCLAM